METFTLRAPIGLMDGVAGLMVLVRLACRQLIWLLKLSGPTMERHRRVR